MKKDMTLMEFTVYFEQFKEEMMIRADMIFDQLWAEAHPEEA